MAHYLIKTSEFITVGESSYFNGTMKRKGTGKITIGSYCAFGDNLNLIAGNNHGYGYAAIQVGFVGNNIESLRQAKDEFRSILEADKRLKNVSDNDQKGGQEFNIELLPYAEALGMDLQRIIRQIRQGYFGLEVQRLQRGKTK